MRRAGAIMETEIAISLGIVLPIYGNNLPYSIRDGQLAYCFPIGTTGSFYGISNPRMIENLRVDDVSWNPAVCEIDDD